MSRIFESLARPWNRCFSEPSISLYKPAHQGGLELCFFPGSLTRRTIWDTAGYKGFHMPLKACAYSEGHCDFFSRNRTLFRSSVTCVELIQELIK